MSWSQQGNAAGYPTVTPAKAATMGSLAVVFRADTAAGIVYVTGGFSTGPTASATLTAQPLGLPFRPLAPVVLPVVGGASASMTVNPDGTVTGSVAVSSSYSLRTFYFTTVTPG